MKNINILFIIFIIISIIFLIYIYNNCILNEKFDVSGSVNLFNKFNELNKMNNNKEKELKKLETSNNVISHPNSTHVIINKNENLIKNYKDYNEDLKYYMNIYNDYFVKDTNKQYANFITNLDRNLVFYKTKLQVLNYPIIMRKENDGYYIDYNIDGKEFANKVMDTTWDDYDPLPSHTIVTIYKIDENFMNKIKELLKEYNYIEYQYSNNKLDVLYDKFMRSDLVNKYITNSSIQKLLQNKNISNKIEKFENNFITTKNINLISNSLNSILNHDQVNTLIKNNQVQDLIKKNNLTDITDELLTTNIEITIETRDYKYNFIYNENDPEADTQLINLFKFIHDKENLDFLNDRFTKNLRYYRIPINIMRIIIKFGEFLKLF